MQTSLKKMYYSHLVSEVYWQQIILTPWSLKILFYTKFGPNWTITNKTVSWCEVDTLCRMSINDKVSDDFEENVV